MALLIVALLVVPLLVVPPVRMSILKAQEMNVKTTPKLLRSNPLNQCGTLRCGTPKCATQMQRYPVLGSLGYSG